MAYHANNIIHSKEHLLRIKAHKLMEIIFPNRAKRYNWLRTHFYKVNMSLCNKSELDVIISCLESKLNGDFCLFHKKFHKLYKVKNNMLKK